MALVDAETCQKHSIANLLPATKRKKLEKSFESLPKTLRK